MTAYLSTTSSSNDKKDNEQLPLAGKVVLFVDDRFDATRLYIDRCVAAGAKILYKSRLADGFVEIDKGGIDIAVLDLHMPPPDFPYRPEHRESILFFTEHSSIDIRQDNLGQMLGHYINEKKEGKPQFLYLSAVAACYVEIPEIENGKTECFDRGFTTPKQLVEAIVTRLIS